MLWIIYFEYFELFVIMNISFDDRISSRLNYYVNIDLFIIYERRERERERERNINFDERKGTTENYLILKYYMQYERNYFDCDK